MAANRTRIAGKRLNLTLSDGGAASGDPARVGQMTGVVEAASVSSKAVLVREGVYNLSVKGVDGSGNAAVALGDVLYYVDADTPKISKKTAGYKIGYALAAVTSGATATIEVVLVGGA
jgi:uncharacterized protein DUF2190